MYTVNKGPSKMVAKTRRGLAQNFEKFETIKEIKQRGLDLNSPEEHNNIPRPVFQQRFASKKIVPTKLIEDDVITPEHEEIIRYINDSWNVVVAQDPYDNSSKPSKELPPANANNNNAASRVKGKGRSSNTIIASTPITESPAVWVEPPSPALRDFKPFDLESWWGHRLFNNITKNL